MLSSCECFNMSVTICRS